MQRCLQLAQIGLPHAMPNPSVGAVVVCQDTIIGEGYTSSYGGDHAEVNAIKSVRNKDLLAKSTLYVSLEPCCHHGKTPPCTSLIIQHQIPEVVIACMDTFAAVNGKGIDILKQAGVNVKTGILEQEAIQLNKRFFTFHQKKRPYVILKWAETSDGFIDIDRIDASKSNRSNWITSQTSKQLVHLWRSQEQSIMIGTNTALNDNPQLTVRDAVGKHPTRIVLDLQLRLPKTLHVFDRKVNTIVINTKLDEEQDQLSYVKVESTDRLLTDILEKLHQRNISSVLVEGGAQLLQEFIDQNLWDEARVFIGQKQFMSGLKAPTLNHTPSSKESIASDQLIIHHNHTLTT